MPRRRRSSPVGTNLEVKIGDLVLCKRESHTTAIHRLGLDYFKRHGLVWRVLDIRVTHGGFKTQTVARLESCTDTKLVVDTPLELLCRVPGPRPPCKITQHKEGPVLPACWEVSYPYRGTMLAVRVPWDSEFIEAFKAAVPGAHRKWNSKQKIWYVEVNHREVVMELMEKFFSGKQMPTGRVSGLRYSRSVEHKEDDGGGEREPA